MGLTTSNSDTLLISRIRAGEADAWNEFIARYEGRLLGFVARRVADRAAAEDLVQETFLGFLNSLPNYDPDQSLEGYLFSIAAHKLTDLLRHEGRRPTMPLVTDESSDGWQPAGAPSRPPRQQHRSQPRAARPGGIRAGQRPPRDNRPLAPPRAMGAAAMHRVALGPRLVEQGRRRAVGHFRAERGQLQIRDDRPAAPPFAAKDCRRRFSPSCTSRSTSTKSEYRNLKQIQMNCKNGK